MIRSGFGLCDGESGENAVEHTEPAPADETIVKRLVRAVIVGRVLPLQPVADHIDDAADDTPVVDARHAMRQRKKRRDARYLALAQQKQIIQQDLPNRKP